MRKHPLRSKTLWFNALVAAVGAFETAAPGVIPPGQTLIAVSVVGAVLRAITVDPVR